MQEYFQICNIGWSVHLLISMCSMAHKIRIVKGECIVGASPAASPFFKVNHF